MSIMSAAGREVSNIRSGHANSKIGRRWIANSALPTPLAARTRPSTRTGVALSLYVLD